MKDHNHIIHFLTHHHDWNPELMEYYVYKIFRTMAFSLLTVFLPIFLYVDLGYSLFEICLFFLINQVFFVILIPFSSKIIQYIGIKHTILLHLPGMIIFSYFLRYLSGNFYDDLLLIIIILLVRVSTKAPMASAELYFMNKHILSKTKKKGTQLASIQIALIIAALISPLIGGFIAHFYGFEMFFNIAILFMVLAAIPFFFTKDEYFKIEKTPSEILTFTHKELAKNFKKAEFGRWFSETAMWIIWPIFLLSIVKETQNIGILLSLSGIVSIILSKYIGKLMDKKNSTLLSPLTNILTGFYFIRVFYPSSITVAIGDIGNKLVHPLQLIPYQKHYFSYLRTIKDQIEAAIAANFVSEFYFTLGVLVLAIYFYIIQILQYEISHIIFLIPFIVFGIQILLTKKISKLSSN
jgi:MFS family permease